MAKPAWIQNAVIYHIFVDRFAGFTSTKESLEPVFLGGNVKGITEKLPYIQSLGANVIWLSPFYEGDTYHGYQTTDFYKIDKHFGTEQDLKELLDQAHKRGLKVICDFVPNHLSSKHPLFLDARKNKDSNYRNWFVFKSWPKKYLCFLGVPSMPKINLDYQPAMEHVRGAARKWLALGFDGMRLDHIIGLSNQNAHDLIAPLRKEFPESVFIGEAWYTGSKLSEVKTIRVPHRYRLWLLWRLRLATNNMLYDNYVGILDGILDFESAELFERFATAKTTWGKNRIKKKIIRKSKTYGSRLLRAVFLDNHDMERFLFRAKDSVETLQMAAEIQFSLKQPIIIYYGTEVGMSQKRPFKARKEHADIYCRQPMVWDISKQNLLLLEFYKSLIRKKLSSKSDHK